MILKLELSNTLNYPPIIGGFFMNRNEYFECERQRFTGNKNSNQRKVRIIYHSKALMKWKWIKSIVLPLYILVQDYVRTLFWLKLEYRYHLS